MLRKLMIAAALVVAVATPAQATSELDVNMHVVLISMGQTPTSPPTAAITPLSGPLSYKKERAKIDRLLRECEEMGRASLEPGITYTCRAVIVNNPFGQQFP